MHRRPDVIELLLAVFGALPASARLFGRRFQLLCRALWIDEAVLWTKVRPLDLGSLRLGGTAALFEATEDAELIYSRRRRLTTRTMLHYVLKVASVSVLASLPSAYAAAYRPGCGHALEFWA